MPQFTQWNVPSPFPNVLYNPMAVDKAIAEMGHLDVERQRLDLDRDQLAKDQAFYAYRFDHGRYDVGNKLDYLKATVEFALERDDIGDDFRRYLHDLMRDDRLR